MQEITKDCNLKEAIMPRGYAKYLAHKLNVPTKRIYKVRYGEQEDKRIYLELLLLAIYFRDEQEALSEAIAKTKERYSDKKVQNQLSMF